MYGDRVPRQNGSAASEVIEPHEGPYSGYCSNGQDANTDQLQAQCEIFSTTYNPDGIRMGNKILRQRLRGPSLAKYYPPRGPSIRELFKQFKHLELEGENEEFEDWQEYLAGRRQRGKAPPKKKRVPPAAPHEKGKK
ncbi:hypothetical protein PG994_001571 [Apiospora phragmitis]|uniref:Small ribosomal subunit protein mS33 n=1 Tax=Apiospora phragmitis TaxID=2905665 RepID=A0ABR1WU08_9PEZI